MFFLSFLLSIRNPYHTQLADLSNISVELPEYYNFLEEYPECDFGPLIQHCGCCYVYSALKSLAHRYCRALRRRIQFSAQYIISCDLFNLGCNGGNEKAVFYYLEQHGVPELECQPWRGIRGYNQEVCKKCVNGKAINLYYAKKRSTKHYVGIENIKKAIYLEGPLSASIVSDYKFIWYKDGLYTSTIDSSTYDDQSNHTIEVHGWGKFDNGTEYWIVQNAFGPIWGQNGLMKLKMGTNEGYSETYMLGAQPDL
ncbi:Clan CA, family C1, cathepsin B-like cysteine peptidase [Trichomonas vaginalis G3]|uniref:Clan CA, family C1, cathepsin B-like cysteine peptidase n=1 Tax=Trichomonas vaginalis (strain ATCC PRA-98 / G3) TaxID=412133 RepID=A2DPZ6_TRIV3|nr:cysteine-type peptidase protein [Trichomonas vaginalis G3]EAY17592.1 Clan CA, family C1, cathepsin B-like cysteine peptidase [Trichomonas vaginalis G3]KAI5520636.1 cysteine-type peptidase protein [Trichomonas vaginalis G3]|eukprot:XP_001329727.1 Clan CA, family C1, cathepsin B-like cysteine peptidase [Trichomonas vaginalis G3]